MAEAPPSYLDATKEVHRYDQPPSPMATTQIVSQQTLDPVTLEAVRRAQNEQQQQQGPPRVIVVNRVVEVPANRCSRPRIIFWTAFVIIKIIIIIVAISIIANNS
ncbi:unnamed protein product, partial [Mesorhabditis belari]|uniref:Transmembrane protein n=1 Tax=Mesorhabditis belari TaxID=2138241 RepID=A0AAF3F8C0_9BILA